MPEFTRKPLKVTAYQFDGTQNMAEKLYRWYYNCKGAWTPVISSQAGLRKALNDPNVKPAFNYDSILGLLSITTDTGAIELSTGDYLVQTPEHEFYQMDPEAFREQHIEGSYRAIVDSPQA